MSDEYKRLEASKLARQNLREARALCGAKEVDTDDAPSKEPPMVAVTEAVAATAFARATQIMQRHTASRMKRSRR